MKAEITHEPSAQLEGMERATSPQLTEIRVRGKSVTVPSVLVNGATVIVTGKWLKIARLHDEELIEGDVLGDPRAFVTALRQKRIADIFTFTQKLNDPRPKYPYAVEWDNAAAIPITTYDEWFRNRAATDVRQNVKKAARRGVVVRSVPFDDQLVKGIVEIYNESPVRQGRPFWHYGKDFDTVKEETSHCLGRSDFIGAYVQDELIGFIKLLRGAAAADIVLIVCKESHFDKRATNALIAKAVEMCVEKQIPYLTYAKFAYGNKTNSSLSVFKSRNGFEQILLPRYYVPLTAKGRLAVRWKLYRKVRDIMPENLLSAILKIRARLNRISCRP